MFVFVSLLFSVFSILPMAAAGGMPYVIGVSLVLMILAFRFVFLKDNTIEFVFREILILAFALFFWEILAAMVTAGDQDVLYAFSRGLWVALGFCYLVFLPKKNYKPGVYTLEYVLYITVVIMSLNMAIGSFYFPEFENGRAFGSFQLSVSRSTGVFEQSDGKLGVLMIIASGYFFAMWSMKGGRILGLMAIISLVPIVFTQSRSTLLAIFVAYMFFCIGFFRISNSKYWRALALIFTVSGLIVGGVYFELILNSLLGEGIFRENISARGVGVSYALDQVAEGLLFGTGSSGMEVDGFGFAIHNTFFALAVKSGLMAGFLFLMFFISCIRLLKYFPNRRKGMSWYVLGLTLGAFVEHWNYPGLFNEHLWLLPCCIVVLLNFSSDIGDIKKRAFN